MSSKSKLIDACKNGVKAIVRQPVINTLGAKAISPWNPVPYRQDFMELKFGVWEGISSYFSEDGRQLGEDNTGPTFRQQKVPTEYRPSKLEGSRNGLSMNISAFRIVMQHWDEAISLLLANRELLLSKSQFSEPLSAYQLLIFSKQVVALPAYMVRANHQEIDSVVATTFQIITGVSMIIEKMIKEGEEWLDTTTRKTAEELFEYADQNGVFISSHGHVCGGSKAKIIELIDLVIHGSRDGSNYVDGSKELKDRVQDLDPYFAYAVHSVKLEKLIQIARLGSDIRGNRHNPNLDFRRLQLLNEVIKEIDQLPINSSSDFSLEELLPKVNESISSELDERLRAETIRMQGLIHQALGYQELKPIPDSLLNKILQTN